MAPPAIHGSWKAPGILGDSDIWGRDYAAHDRKTMVLDKRVRV